MSMWNTMRSLRRKTVGGRSPTLTDLLVAFTFICLLAVPTYLWLGKVLKTSEDPDSELMKLQQLSVDERRARDAVRPPSALQQKERYKERLEKHRREAETKRRMVQQRQQKHARRGNPGFRKPGEFVPRNYVAGLERPMRCKNCTHVPFPKVTKEIQNICKGNQRGRDNTSVVDLVILIFSQTENYQGRMALRQTWLQISKKNKSNVRYVFITGKGKKNTDQKKYEPERRKFRDILAANFEDGVGKQTEKLLIGLKWVTRYCRHARHVLKTEDDVWVNVPSLLSWLKAHPISQPFALAGYCVPHNKPSRDHLSKYFIPQSFYPQEYYPPFCNSPGYLTTPQTAKQVLRVSREVPYFPLEDVYLGFCLQALNMHVQRVSGFSNDKLEVLQKWDPDDVMHDVALAESNRVTVADYTLVGGLERRIVVGMGAKGPFTYSKMLVMSRCTSQLVWIDPDPDFDLPDGRLDDDLSDNDSDSLWDGAEVTNI